MYYPSGLRVWLNLCVNIRNNNKNEFQQTWPPWSRNLHCCVGKNVLFMVVLTYKENSLNKHLMAVFYMPLGTVLGNIAYQLRVWIL